MYDEYGNWIDLGGGSGGDTVDVIPAPPEYDTSANLSITPLSPADEAQYQKDLASSDAQAQLQAPNIQNISDQINNFQDILPADLTSQIQLMSKNLLQQQSDIQKDVKDALAQQKATNDAAIAYQKIYASASPQITTATADYNSALAGYNQAYAQYAKSHNPNYLGSVLGQLQRDIPNVSAGWFLSKMNTDKATITNLNNQITTASTSYANDLATYKATSADLKLKVSNYNADYTNYTGAVATAQGDVKAAQEAAAAKAKADQQAAADKAAADKAAADAAAAAKAKADADAAAAKQAQDAAAAAKDAEAKAAADAAAAKAAQDKAVADQLAKDVASKTTTPTTNDPQTQLKALLSIGTPDVLSKYTSLFGTGATAQNGIDFYNLIVWDDANKKYVINQVNLNDVIAKNPTQSEQIKSLVSQSIDSVNSQIAADPTKAPTPGSGAGAGSGTSGGPSTGSPGGGGGGGGGGGACLLYTSDAADE